MHGQMERCPETQRLHLQFWVNYRDGVREVDIHRWGKLNKYVSSFHSEEVKGTYEDNEK